MHEHRMFLAATAAFACVPIGLVVAAEQDDRKFMLRVAAMTLMLGWTLGAAIFSRLLAGKWDVDRVLSRTLVGRRPTLVFTLGLLAATAAALVIALITALGLAAFLRLAEVVGRVTALTLLLGWPLGPSLHMVLTRCPVRQPSLVGFLRRRMCCTRVPAVLPEADDECPICLMPLTHTAVAELEHCQWGCGRSVHVECMRRWAASCSVDHDGARGCVLCRAQWR